MRLTTFMLWKSYVREIRHHSHQYYTLGEPKISDEAYDDLMKKLIEFEKEHKIDYAKSPTKLVGEGIALNRYGRKRKLETLRREDLWDTRKVI